MLSKRLHYPVGRRWEAIAGLESQLHESLGWDIAMKLAYPVEDLYFLVSDRLAETLHDPERP